MIGIILFFIFSYFKGRIISKNLCENGPQSSVISMTSDLNFSLVCDLFLKYTPPVIILLYIIKLNDDLFGLLPCGPQTFATRKKPSVGTRNGINDQMKSFVICCLVEDMVHVCSNYKWLTIRIFHPETEFYYKFRFSRIAVKIFRNFSALFTEENDRK